MGAKWVLQIQYGYGGPFLEISRQYAALFNGTPYRVLTVYLTEPPDERVEKESGADKVVFLNYQSSEIRGLKRAAIADIRRIAKQYDFAFCIAHRYKPIYIACLGAGLPVIGVQHHAVSHYRSVRRRLFARLFQRRLSLLAVSNAVRDDMRAALPFLSADRIQTLYNGIDFDVVRASLLSRTEARKALGLPEDAWVVGNVGRVIPDKDQATLIRGFAVACAELPKTALLAIVGSGRLEQELKELAVQLRIDDRVHFLGRVPEARRYFAAFDVFALSSVREAFGMVLLEAMTAGIPIVATECGGVPELLSGLAETFPVGRHDVLARLLIEESRRGASGIERLRVAMSERVQSRFSYGAAKRQFAALQFLPAGVELCASNEQAGV